VKFAAGPQWLKPAKMNQAFIAALKRGATQTLGIACHRLSVAPASPRGNVTQDSDRGMQVGQFFLSSLSSGIAFSLSLRR
jgi:hypothetical protein